MFQKLLSYFLPIKLKEYTSQKSGIVEVTLVDGKKVLDTKVSNYSYGSLQKNLHTGLNAAHFDKNVRSVLVLGMGAGSVVQTIRENFQSNAQITLVEIDETIIEIARKEFDIERYGNLEIVHSDAFDYLEKTPEKFDFIIVDLFILDKIPVQFTEAISLKNIAQKLNKNGKLIYNTMTETMPKTVLQRLKNELEKNGLEISILENVNFTNRLLVSTNATTFIF